MNARIVTAVIERGTDGLFSVYVADGKEGIKGVTLSNAMHLSHWLGKEIEIPFDEDLFYDELMKRVATSKKKENVREAVSDTSGSY